MTFLLRRLFVAILITLSFFLCEIFAQQLSNPSEEETVKLSGEYYWGETTGKDLKETKSMTRQILLKMILEDYKSRTDMSQVKSIHAEGIEYLFYMRGPRYRIIAFINKNKVYKNLETRKEMQIVEMIYTDKYPDDMPADSEETKTENLFIEKHKQDTLTSNQIIIPLDTSLYNEDKIVEIEETENENHIVKGQKKSIGEIREELSGITDANEFLQLLNIYKLKGILVFGGKDAFNDPEKCDMAIFNPVTKEVLAYLLQSEKKFIDYKSNEPIKDYSITFNGMTAIWIKYFK